MKALVWSGAVIAAIGVAILAMFVIPHVGAPDAVPGLNGLPQGAACVGRDRSRRSVWPWARCSSASASAAGSIRVTRTRWTLVRRATGRRCRGGRARSPSPPLERRDVPPSDARSFARRVWITVAIVAACALGALGIWAGRSALLLIYTSLLLATGPASGHEDRARRRRTALVAAAVVRDLRRMRSSSASCRSLRALIVPTLVAQADELSRRLPSLLASWQSGLVKHGWLARPLTIADAVQQSATATAPADNAPIAIAASAVRGLAFASSRP